ncbi:MAG: NADH-quinone oxidoreductase subunit N, partial [Candidatus Promineifilaceae bacterium]
MDFQPPDVNLLLIFPFLWLTGWAIALMLLDLALPAARRGWLPWLALAGILPAFVQAAGLWGYDGGTFSVQGGAPALAVDNFSTFINLTLLATAGLSVLISIHYLQKADIERPEYYYLMLFSVGGMMLMGMANDLILIFLALELLSIPLYVLSGFARPRVDSEESAMKYFLLGAFSSGFLVYGIALIYGYAGS